MNIERVGRQWQDSFQDVALGLRSAARSLGNVHQSMVERVSGGNVSFEGVHRNLGPEVAAQVFQLLQMQQEQEAAELLAQLFGVSTQGAELSVTRNDDQSYSVSFTTRRPRHGHSGYFSGVTHSTTQTQTIDLSFTFAQPAQPVAASDTGPQPANDLVDFNYAPVASLDKRREVFLSIGGNIHSFRGDEADILFGLSGTDADRVALLRKYQSELGLEILNFFPSEDVSLRFIPSGDDPRVGEFRLHIEQPGNGFLPEEHLWGSPLQWFRDHNDIELTIDAEFFDPATHVTTIQGNQVEVLNFDGGQFTPAELRTLTAVDWSTLIGDGLTAEAWPDVRAALVDGLGTELFEKLTSFTTRTSFSSGENAFTEVTSDWSILAEAEYFDDPGQALEGFFLSLQNGGTPEEKTFTVTVQRQNGNSEQIEIHAVSREDAARQTIDRYYDNSGATGARAQTDEDGYFEVSLTGARPEAIKFTVDEHYDYSADVSIYGNPPITYQATATSDEAAIEAISQQLLELAASLSGTAGEPLDVVITPLDDGTAEVAIRYAEDASNPFAVGTDVLTATVALTESTNPSSIVSAETSGSRRLQASDDEVSGTSLGDVRSDASFERANLLWEALIETFGSDLPPVSPEDIFNLVLQVQTGHSTGVDQRFFDLVFQNNGAFSSDLELEHPHYDPELLGRVFDDAAFLFHAVNAHGQQHSHGRGHAPGSSVSFAPIDDAGAVRETFFNSLRTDTQGTGRTDFVSNRSTTDSTVTTQWYDFTTTGFADIERIQNGNIHDEDITNHSLVKSVLWVGREVIGELPASANWTGPSAADFDSATFVDDFAVVEVTYEHGGEQVTRFVSVQELQTLIEDGTVSYDLDENITSYVVEIDGGSLGPGTKEQRYDITYFDKNTGRVVQGTALTNAERQTLVDRHEAGSITIVGSQIKDHSTAKLFWANTALQTYDVTRTPVYDANGQITSGASALTRLAQAFSVNHDHFNALHDVSENSVNYGFQIFHPFADRNGQIGAPFLAPTGLGDPSSRTDGEAVNHLLTVLGLSEGDTGYDSLGEVLGSVKGATDVTYVSNHYGENHNWFSTGNLGHLEASRTAVDDALAARGRSTSANEAHSSEQSQATYTQRVVDTLLTVVDVALFASGVAAPAAAFLETVGAAVEAGLAEGVEFGGRSASTRIILEELRPFAYELAQANMPAEVNEILTRSAFSRGAIATLTDLERTNLIRIILQSAPNGYAGLAASVSSLHLALGASAGALGLSINTTESPWLAGRDVSVGETTQAITLAEQVLQQLQNGDTVEELADFFLTEEDRGVDPDVLLATLNYLPDDLSDGILESIATKVDTNGETDYFVLVRDGHTYSALEDAAFEQDPNRTSAYQSALNQGLDDVVSGLAGANNDQLTVAVLTRWFDANATTVGQIDGANVIILLALLPSTGATQLVNGWAKADPKGLASALKTLPGDVAENLIYHIGPDAAIDVLVGLGDGHLAARYVLNMAGSGNETTIINGLTQAVADGRASSKFSGDFWLTLDAAEDAAVENSMSSETSGRRGLVFNFHNLPDELANILNDENASISDRFTLAAHLGLTPYSFTHEEAERIRLFLAPVFSDPTYGPLMESLSGNLALALGVPANPETANPASYNSPGIQNIEQGYLNAILPLIDTQFGSMLTTGAANIVNVAGIEGELQSIVDSFVANWNQNADANGYVQIESAPLVLVQDLAPPNQDAVAVSSTVTDPKTGLERPAIIYNSRFASEYTLADVLDTLAHELFHVVQDNYVNALLAGDALSEDALSFAVANYFSKQDLKRKFPTSATGRVEGDDRYRIRFHELQSFDIGSSVTRHIFENYVNNETHYLAASPYSTYPSITSIVILEKPKGEDLYYQEDVNSAAKKLASWLDEPNNRIRLDDFTVDELEEFLKNSSFENFEALITTLIAVASGDEGDEGDESVLAVLKEIAKNPAYALLHELIREFEGAEQFFEAAGSDTGLGDVHAQTGDIAYHLALTLSTLSSALDTLALDADLPADVQTDLQALDRSDLNAVLEFLSKHMSEPIVAKHLNSLATNGSFFESLTQLFEQSDDQFNVTQLTFIQQLRDLRPPTEDDEENEGDKKPAAVTNNTGVPPTITANFAVTNFAGLADALAADGTVPQSLADFALSASLVGGVKSIRTILRLLRVFLTPETAQFLKIWVQNPQNRAVLEWISEHHAEFGLNIQDRELVAYVLDGRIDDLIPPPPTVDTIETTVSPEANDGVADWLHDFLTELENNYTPNPLEPLPPLPDFYPEFGLPVGEVVQSLHSFALTNASFFQIWSAQINSLTQAQRDALIQEAQNPAFGPAADQSVVDFISNTSSVRPPADDYSSSNTLALLFLSLAAWSAGRKRPGA